MRITSIVVFKVIRQYNGRAWNPATRWHRKCAVLLEVQTDVGLSGIGECSVDDASESSLIGILRDELAPRVIGKDPRLIEQVWRCTAGADLSRYDKVRASGLSGLDIALWDLLGKICGQPLYRLLGGYSESAPVYGSGGLYVDGEGEHELADEMRQLVASGFETVKMKICGLAAEADLARVARVHDALGNNHSIIVDAVCSLEPRDATHFCAKLADLGVEAIQAPFPAGKLAEWRHLAQTTPIRVLGMEWEHRLPTFAQLLASGTVSCLQFSLIACGGITQGLSLVALAAAWGVPCTLQCSSSAVAQMASFHLAAARSGVQSVEYHQFHRLLYEFLPPEVETARAGRVLLPTAPGLGLEIPGDAKGKPVTIVAED